MKRSELYQIRRRWLDRHAPYKLYHWIEYDYKILNNVMYRKRSGRGDNNTYNDCIIMADTETSKKNADIIGENHVVAWTISIRAFNRNICTLYGHKPSSFVSCVNKIRESMVGKETIFYFHNLAYDWVFLRKFIMQEYGLPDRQLNTKSHYPIHIAWENGFILKDSLILAQRSLDKWSNDLDVEHKKALGKWDYDKIRTQQEEFTPDELEYIEHDTLAGVECLQKMCDTLHKSIYSLPYTATGIPREEVRNRAEENRGHELFTRQALEYEQQNLAEQVYHGGYTHANRHLINWTINDIVECYDFSSSYPFCMLAFKFPMEKFTPMKNCSLSDILEDAADVAYMFKLILVNVRLKDDFQVMPALQYSKCVHTVNAITDNGRILRADYVEIYITELDAEVINKMYIWDKHICVDILAAEKDYLPRWFTDYIYSLYEAKTKLKGGDPVAYALAKARLNSLYGLCVEKPIKETITEDYKTGEYNIEENDREDLYDKYVNRRKTVLPYQWGIWVTAYAFRNLFRLGACCDTWVYSDTDSCYGIGWNEEKLNEYNEQCKTLLKENGYGAVLHNDREYWLGIAEFDGQYSEFRVQGAKRYCGRSTKDGELHITVAGVPKKGAEVLNNDIGNFRPLLIFPGIKTGKKTHTYFYIEDIYTDSMGNETGDSIDLSPCDYLLSSVNVEDWKILDEEEVEIQTYEE